MPLWYALRDLQHRAAGGEADALAQRDALLATLSDDERAAAVADRATYGLDRPVGEVEALPGA